MFYKIKLKFISRNNQPVPNLYYEAGIGYKKFSHGYSNQKTGESIIFEVKGTVTTIQVSKEPNNTVQLVTLQQIEHNKLSKISVNEITIIVPVQMISFLLEEQKTGTYERNITTTPENTKQNIIQPQNLYPNIVFHTVKHGESLVDIAQRYTIPVEELKRINSLNTSELLINQKLYIKEAQLVHEKQRKLANFLVLVSILGASRRTSNPVTVIEKKEGTKQFFISLSGQIAAGLGLGAGVQVGAATDERGNIGIFVTVGGQAIAAGTPGFAIDGGVTLTDAKDIRELSGWGYSVGAQLHVLAGTSVEIGTATTDDIDTGKTKKVTSKTQTEGIGAGSNAGFGTGYTWIVPIKTTKH